MAIDPKKTTPRVSAHRGEDSPALSVTGDDAEKTQRLDNHGSWRRTEPLVPVTQQGAEYSPSARLSWGSRIAGGRPEHRARARGLRALSATLLALTAVVLGISGATAYWVQQHLVDPAGFAQLSNEMAHDREFQSTLAQAVTNDIMTSDMVKNSVGDGHRDGILGTVQNWAHGQLSGAVSSATQSVVESDQYPQVWNQVTQRSHAYLMAVDSRAAALVIGPVFDAVDQSIGTVAGFDPDLKQFGERMIYLDAPQQGSYPIHDKIMQLQDFSKSWMLQLVLAGVCAVVAFLIFPGKRFYFAAVVTALVAAGLFFCTQNTSYITDQAGQLQVSTDAGRVFINQLATRVAAGLGDFWHGLIGPIVLVAAAFLVIGMLIQLAQLSARTRGRSSTV